MKTSRAARGRRRRHTAFLTLCSHQDLAAPVSPSDLLPPGLYRIHIASTTPATWRYHAASSLILSTCDMHAEPKRMSQSSQTCWRDDQGNGVIWQQHLGLAGGMSYPRTYNANYMWQAIGERRDVLPTSSSVRSSHHWMARRDAILPWRRDVGAPDDLARRKREKLACARALAGRRSGLRLPARERACP